MVLGNPDFFTRFGYSPAFDLYTVGVYPEDLPQGGGTGGWRGLSAPDIPHLVKLYHDNYGDTDGTEERTEAALDWECNTENAHTLVLEEQGRVEAYLRFRVRDQLEVRECGVRTAAGITGVLHFLQRLLAEHGRARIEVHVPPIHPVARALFHSGSVIEMNNFQGAAMLNVLDWPGILMDTGPSWVRALEGAERKAISLEIGGEPIHLSLHRGEFAVDLRREERCHLYVPPGWGPPLLTGQRNHRDLFFLGAVQERSTLDEAGQELVRRLFPGGHPMWPYSPVFEIADD